MRLIILDYSDGIVYLGQVEDTNNIEREIDSLGFSQDAIERMATDDLHIEPIK